MRYSSGFRSPSTTLRMSLTSDELVARILHRDANMIIVDKPAGIAVHAGPREKRSLEDHFDALTFGLPRLPALAHRLDRDTSGCLVLGRHRKALARLGKLFAAGRVAKTYWAVVEGTPPKEQGRIDLPILKIVEPRSWRIVVDPKGQPAVTDYRVMGRSDGLTWLELRPRTGRTHQIRVHCAALGCPLLGDRFYGRDKETTIPMHLHARGIAVPGLSANKPPVAVVAPPPAHMLAALRACGYDPDAPPAPPELDDTAGA